ncbi:MAG: dicarboxylate/amino acid:cation symporter [Tissierellia bacterium]|nr:dicarboxylate/amino acid:cation symporter [Tissierellia bacterium]
MVKLKRKEKLTLTSKIFIGLILGAIVGILINKFLPSGHMKDDILVGGAFRLVGDGFIRAMQMLVVPLVFSSLVTGSMSMGDTKQLGKVGAQTIVFYLITTALAISVALGIASIIKPGIGMDLSQVKQATDVAVSTEAPNMIDTILNIIPTNPLKSLAEGEMLQIIFFALVVGILLARLGERAAVVSNFISQFNDVMMDMTMMVMKFAPLGVFALIAKTFSNIGFDAFLPMLKYMASVLLALFVQCTVVYMLLLQIFSGINPFIFLRRFFPVMGFAFSTASSNATVPASINKLDEMGISKKISSFTVPLGATINMDGTSIMQGVAVVFVAQAYNIPLTITDFLTVIFAATLASVGTAGIPSVGLITLSMVFNSVGLPVEGIAMIMGIDRILDMIRTSVNVTGDAVVTAIMAKRNGLFDKEKFYSKDEKSNL